MSEVRSRIRFRIDRQSQPITMAITNCAGRPRKPPIPWDALASPLSAADDALARFDERLRTSPIRDGVIARLDFADACACLWLAGELVTAEDLVLHDAERDLRMPSHALTQAHTVLRSRRRIARQPADWALRPPGLANLRGITRAGRGGSSHRPRPADF